MNVRDSEVIRGLLEKAGYEICLNDKGADVVIFNTCSVRQHAEDRVWSLIGSYKGKKIIGLVGCMAQSYKQRAFERDPGIAFVVGPQDIAKIPAILDKLSCRADLFERKIWETDAERRPEEIYHTGFSRENNQGYVVISEGCSNFCSYCIVPYVRGALRHRKCEQIILEIKQAVASGVGKITLLGQNVNAYCDEGVNFVGLLEKVNALDGLKSFTFFTSHPKDADEEFFRAIRDLDKLDKSLHLPVQSGSDRILKLMNRGYSLKEYLDLIHSYRKIVKGGVLTSDIIVGFPGESERDFADTCDLVNDAQFNAAYIFKYSPRPNTQAAKMADLLTVKEKENRHRHILELQRRISAKLRGKRAHAKN
jgi:tRNA-2-methylthio-N6-dimethylallyladenosine synthase